MRTPIAALCSALAALSSTGGSAVEPEAPPAPTVAPALGPAADGALPWLRGFPADSVAVAQRDASDARFADPACASAADPGASLSAELAPAPGLETVRASFAGGVEVLDARGRRLAATPPFACRGSADAIEGLATGELLPGERAIALAVTAGGRAERTTWLYFFELRGDRLAQLFVAPVEETRGQTVATGEVARLPGGALRYRAPDQGITRWSFDRGAGRFVIRDILRRPTAPIDPIVPIEPVRPTEPVDPDPDALPPSA